MNNANDESLVNNGTCEYVDLNNVKGNRFFNSKVHLIARSLTKKVGNIELPLSYLGYPKLMFLTETWLASNSSLLNIVNYAFVSSHRTFSHGRGVAI